MLQNNNGCGDSGFMAAFQKFICAFANLRASLFST
jgi:hypothetical protein